MSNVLFNKYYSLDEGSYQLTIPVELKKGDMIVIVHAVNGYSGGRPTTLTVGGQTSTLANRASDSGNGAYINYYKATEYMLNPLIKLNSSPSTGWALNIVVLNGFSFYKRYDSTTNVRFSSPTSAVSISPSSSYNIVLREIVDETILEATVGSAWTFDSQAVVFMKDNNIPQLELKDKDNLSISNSSVIKIYDKSDFSLTINANDEDTNDTLQYSVLLNGEEKTTWTSIGKNVNVPYTILNSNLLTGNNTVIIKVKDSRDSTNGITFYLRNLVPDSYCQKHVLELINKLR